MVKNYFLITVRSILKNKVFVIINVLGTGIAIACCIVGYLLHRYDGDFDLVHVNSENIYRVSSIQNFENNLKRYGTAPLPLGEIINKTFKHVDGATRYVESSSNFKRDEDLFESNLAYVDPDFFQMFSFNFISGDPSRLADKSSLFISESMAVRLFGTTSEAYGKTITQVYRGELKEVIIAGIYLDPPMNSSFYRMAGSAFMNFDNHKDEYQVREDDWQRESTLFVRINDRSMVPGVQNQLQPFIANNNKIREDFQVSEFVLDQFNTMAHRDRSDQVRSSTWQAPPKSAIVGSIVMAILILLIACFNLTNTAIAISSRRLKEIGIRKVMGSMRMHLIIQFIGETLFICTCALLVGIALADWLIMGWNNMVVYIRLTPNYLTDPGFLFFAVGLLLFTALLAGGYPAFYISKFQPVTILKGKLKLAGTNNFTRSLLGLQFTISLITIVSAIGFFQNARYQQGYDLGFNVRGTIMATVHNQSEFETFRNALLKDPNIITMAGTRTGIFSERTHEPVSYESLKLDVDIIDVGENYLKTMDLHLLEGRDFLTLSETDQKESVIITEKMAKELGWKQALGKQIVWRDSVKLFVIGVVKDVYTAGLWRELEPMMIRYVLPQSYTQIVVSTSAEKVSATNAAMSEQWSRIFPNRLYNGRMLVEDLKSVVDVNMTTMYLYAFLGSIAMMLSATGLFTLISMNIIKRRKEIGVRKILGASLSNIGWTLNTEFALILVVASILGTLASYSMSNAIMSSIWKYYKVVDISTFILSISLLMAVSLITIGIKVFSIATMNPVTSLRDE